MTRTEIERLTTNTGRCPDGPGSHPSGRVSDAVPSVPVSIPYRWFCDKGDFWGTTKQLLLCARCGQNEFKRRDEPRRYGHVGKPTIHTICDACFDALPEGEPAGPVVEDHAPIPDQDTARKEGE